MTEAAYTKAYIDRAEGQTHLLLDDVQADDQYFFRLCFFLWTSVLKDGLTRWKKILPGSSIP